MYAVKPARKLTFAEQQTADKCVLECIVCYEIKNETLNWELSVHGLTY